MKIVDERFFLRKGDFAISDEFSEILLDIHDGIKLVTHPPGVDKFIIKPTKKGNGVKPLKENLISHLGNKGWKHEQRFKIVDGIGAGPIDSIIETSFGIFAIEWETGNISSSHRALNKIATAIIQKHIIGGILILPDKNLANYLTDRIGNYPEISPYFEMYDRLQIEVGVMGAISVTYDAIDENVPLIPKGNDGNSKNK